MYIHVEMKYVWVFSLVTLVLSVSGCAGMSHKDNARFQAVVAKNVSVEMPFVTTIEHLAKAGFPLWRHKRRGGRYVHSRGVFAATFFLCSAGECFERYLSKFGRRGYARANCVRESLAE